MEAIMEVIYERVAGLDVHKDSVVACVRLMSASKARRECLNTTTDGLLALLEWLTSCRCAVVVMEATGVYWMPVWKILSDGAFTLIVANALALSVNALAVRRYANIAGDYANPPRSANAVASRAPCRTRTITISASSTL
jgi:transposase